MINRKNYVYKDQVSMLCDIMVNCQCLLLDIEVLEEDGLFRHDLKRSAKNFLEILEKSVDAVYDTGHKQIYNAIKEGKSKEEIEEIKERHKSENLEMVHVYEAILESRKLFDSIPYSEKIKLINNVNETV